MAIFRIEEYYPRPDGTRELLGSYRIPDSETDKVAALLDVLSAEGRRAGGYMKTAVYLDDTPVNVFVDNHNKLNVVRQEKPQTEDSRESPARPSRPVSDHTISIHEYYVQPDGQRNTFGIYRIPANDRRKAAAILEVASARKLRSGDYGDVAIYLDDRLMNASIDDHNELVLTPAHGE